MSHDSRGNEPDQVNNGALAVILGIVALATLAVALVVTALVRDEVRDLRGVRDASQDREYRDLKAAQLGKLEGSPAWVDKAQGVVSLPISRAIALTLGEVRANPAKLSPWFTSTAPAETPAAPETSAATEAPASTESVAPAAPVAPVAAAPSVVPAGPAVVPAAPKAVVPAPAPTKAVAPAPIAPAPVKPSEPAAPSTP
jgi:hypothetical protein